VTDEERSGSRSLWTIVAGREILVKLTDKNFIISTVVTLAFLAGSLGLQSLLGRGADDITIAVTGPQSHQVLEQVDRLASERNQPMKLTITDERDAAAVTAAVRSKTAQAGLVHDGASWRLIGISAPDAALTASVREAVQQQALTTNATAAGTSVDTLTRGSDVALDVLDPNANPGLRYIVGFAFAFLFYLASLLFGMTIASSVVEEKQSRVVEILVTAVPLRQLLLGKVAGNTVLAMAQMVVFVGVGLVGMSFTSYSSVLPSLAAASGWFLIFFLAGFVALACLWAVAGSLATRNEDLQSTTPALTTVLIVAMMVGLVGEGTVRAVGSYIPVISTVAMPMRLFTGEASWWEPIVSLVITLVFAAGAISVGERLYRRSVLQTQRRMTIREAIRAGD
ncbi:MAG: ABC transporter permease, partial [Lapillicoccus sp.]